VIRIASLFSGIGGFELGFQQASASTSIDTEIVFASEMDKYARKLYNKNFGVEPHGDITKITADDIPDHDILCGGFPCQSFSIAGKRRGFEDTRGTLFFEIARILERKQPRMFLLENVKGLLSHSKGNTFTKILQTLDELGYDAEWQVFNSKNHGVPQNRERVFIVGHLRGQGGEQIFPITEGAGRLDEGHKQPTVNTLTAGGHSGGHHSSMTLLSSQAQALTETRTEEAKEIRRNTLGKDFSPRRGKVLVPRTDGIANCCTSGQSKEHLIQLNNPTHSNNRVYDANGISPAINCMEGGNRQRIRRLTPTECERLQGFPDGHTEGISNTQRYKCLGNAVTVNVVEMIARRMLLSLGQ